MNHPVRHILDLTVVIPMSRPKECANLLQELCNSASAHGVYPIETLIVTHPWLACEVSLSSRDEVSARVIETNKTGAPARRNFGTLEGQGTWVLFLDDDISVDKNWINGIHSISNRYLDWDIFTGNSFVIL